MKTKAVPAWAQRALAERCEAKVLDSITRKVSVPDLQCQEKALSTKQVERSRQYPHGALCYG